MDYSEQVDKFKEFIESNYLKQLHNLIKKGKSALIIDFAELSKFDFDLAEELLSDPENTIKSAEIALENIDLPEKSFRIRFKNLPKSQFLPIKEIRSKDLKKFIVIEGIVRRATDVRPQVVCAKFECPSCGNSITILQVDSKFKEPTRCSCGRKGRFRMLAKDLVDAQMLIIEEIPEILEGGEQAKRLPIFLKEDLVDPEIERRNTPGSKIRIYGIIKEIPEMTKAGAQSTRYDLVMEANYTESIEEYFSDITLSEKEKEEIETLAKDPKIYEKLINSIAPSIHGHERVKEAIVLQLMGGTKKINEDNTVIRGDIHILLVGDPGAGKSQILKFVSKAAPKARFVSGKGASGAGLTASVVRDEYLKGWALEAGALVLANGGYCMIDELDKMTPEDRSTMHEALEQQTVSIAKANIQATLRAETTVLAAANPKFGRFELYGKKIAEQMDLPPTLINRFDLIFPMKDIPNKKKDEKIATHILKLQQARGIIHPEIPVEMLKKYIAYVKQNIFPTLTSIAMDEIRNFYVELRNQPSSSFSEEEPVKPIPISARQLEALVRVAEASAKIRLSDKVTKQDARRAIDLFKYYLNQVGMDPETGKIDIDRFSTTFSASERGKLISVREIINELEKVVKPIPLDSIFKQASEKGISNDNVYDALEKLKRSGDIFEPKKGFVQKI